MKPVNLYNKFHHIQYEALITIWENLGLTKGDILRIDRYHRINEMRLSNHIFTMSTPQIPIETIRLNIQTNPNRNRMGFRTSNLVESFIFNIT